MNRERHRILLTVVMLLLSPGTLLAGLLIIAALATGNSTGWVAKDIIAIAVMTPALAIFGYGCFVFNRMRFGFREAHRRHLLVFYLLNLLHVGMWLQSTCSRDNHTYQIFDTAAQISGFGILLALVCAVLFTEPERG